MNAAVNDDEIRRLVEQYSPSLLRLACTRLSPADAEDAVQEVFLKLVAARPVFQGPEHEKAWLIRATLHRASDIRRRADRQAVSLEETGSQVPAREDDATTLLSAVQALPEAYSAVIHLYYYEGYSIKEIEKLLRLPASTVGTRLARGRERLRRMLKEEMS